MANFSQGGFGGLARGLEAGLGVAKQFRDSDLAERRFQSDKDLQNRKFQLDKAAGGRAQQELSRKIGTQQVDNYKQMFENILKSDVAPQAKMDLIKNMRESMIPRDQAGINASGVNIDLDGLAASALGQVVKLSDIKTNALNQATAQTQEPVLKANEAIAASKAPPSFGTRPTAEGLTQPVLRKPAQGTLTDVGPAGVRASVQAPNIGGILPNTKGAVSKERAGARDLIAGVATMRRRGENLIESIKRGGEAVSSGAGSVANFGTSALGTVKGLFDLARGLGEPAPDLSSFDTDGKKTSIIDKSTEANTALEKAGVANADLRRQYIGLAWAAAAARGQRGRGLSDKDFDRVILEVGGAGSVPQRVKVVKGFLKDIEDDTRDKYSATAKIFKDAGLPPADEVFGKRGGGDVPVGATQAATAAEGFPIFAVGGKWVKADGTPYVPGVK